MIASSVCSEVHSELLPGLWTVLLGKICACIFFQVEEGILKLRNAGTEQDLGIQYKALKPEVDKLNIMAAKRQQVW